MSVDEYCGRVLIGPATLPRSLDDVPEVRSTLLSVYAAELDLMSLRSLKHLAGVHCLRPSDWRNSMHVLETGEDRFHTYFAKGTTPLAAWTMLSAAQEIRIEELRETWEAIADPNRSLPCLSKLRLPDAPDQQMLVTMCQVQGGSLHATPSWRLFDLLLVCEILPLLSLRMYA